MIDFYYQIDKLEGGELKVLNETIREKLHVPCEIGVSLKVICHLTAIIGENLYLPSYFIFNQCIRDLKASAYLLLSAHYRNAIQILRPVIENYLVALYFDAKCLSAQNEKEIDIAYEEFEKFWEGNYEISAEEWKKIILRE